MVEVFRALKRSCTCWLFQLYFYKNVSDPEENSKIINNEVLNKKTIEDIMNGNIF